MTFPHNVLQMPSDFCLAAFCLDRHRPKPLSGRRGGTGGERGSAGLRLHLVGKCSPSLGKPAPGGGGRAVRRLRSHPRLRAHCHPG